MIYITANYPQFNTLQVALLGVQLLSILCERESKMLF